eukprot:gnl/TRDRNA2_/TRDRNA2_120694_c0_seq1.p1 gnl/TRDRNA2_/TRDRNA2_120694_c0~~gnl/TRDRNA2_/TRDRNA2_120694_c0_seq1.p1  ORF type:complete len:119 (+),score=12.06 gnl/TRDRNA2_/TRDRNA2_120694_c0_seq1:1-357(+)
MGSQEDPEKVRAAQMAIDPMDNFDEVGHIERCARPGCVCVSESSLRRASQALAGARRFESAQSSLPDGLKVAKLSKCGLCKAAAYCSRDCQKLDWARHKEYCTSLAAQQAVGSASLLV